MNFLSPPTAAVVMSPDRGLVHPGDQSGPAGRTNRCGDEGLTKQRPVARESIDVRCFDQRLAVRGEIRRHIVDDDPDDIRRDCLGRRCGHKKTEKSSDHEGRLPHPVSSTFHGTDDPSPALRRESVEATVVSKTELG